MLHFPEKSRISLISKYLHKPWNKHYLRNFTRGSPSLYHFFFQLWSHQCSPWLPTVLQHLMSHLRNGVFAHHPMLSHIPTFTHQILSKPTKTSLSFYPSHNNSSSMYTTLTHYSFSPDPSYALSSNTTEYPEKTTQMHVPNSIKESEKNYSSSFPQ